MINTKKFNQYSKAKHWYKSIGKKRSYELCMREKEQTHVGHEGLKNFPSQSKDKTFYTQQ